MFISFSYAPEPVICEVQHGSLVAAPLSAASSGGSTLGYAQRALTAQAGGQHRTAGGCEGGGGAMASRCAGGGRRDGKQVCRWRRQQCKAGCSLGSLDIRVPAVRAVGPHARLHAGGCTHKQQQQAAGWGGQTSAKMAEPSCPRPNPRLQALVATSRSQSRVAARGTHPTSRCRR